jgi:hypothetical protein
MKTIYTLLFSTVLISFFACQKEVHFIGDTPGKIEDTSLTKFLAATGISDATLKMNLDSLVTRAKHHGWWDLCIAVYPMAGGTAKSCAVNLKSPGTFDITWAGSPSFHSDGVDGFTESDYGDTNFNDTLFAYNNASMGFYSLTNNTNCGYDMGNYGAGVYNEIGAHLDCDFEDFFGGSDFGYQPENSIGWIMASSTSSNVKFYWNDSVFYSKEGIGDNTHYTGSNMNIGWTNDDSPPNRKCGFAIIGKGFTDLQESQMYHDIADFVSKK